MYGDAAFSFQDAVFPLAALATGTVALVLAGDMLRQAGGGRGLLDFGYRVLGTVIPCNPSALPCEILRPSL